MKKRGRPPLDPTDRSVMLNLTLPARQYDRYCAQARAHAVSVPEIIRRTLDNKKLKTSGQEPPR